MNTKTAKEILRLIDSSVSCYHAVANMSAMLTGFVRLHENEEWRLKRGGSYYVVRNDSSIIAFKIPKDDFSSIHIVASHSDSPCFKIKPSAEMTDSFYTRLNTEKYGGAIMYSWLDRPLSVAGRVVVSKGIKPKSILVNIDKDFILIPSVAIHMNREINDGFKFNPQVDTIPLYGDEKAKGTLAKIIADACGVNSKDILGADLCLYLRQKGTIWGHDNEYVSSRALDDLECAFTSVKAFADSESKSSALTLCCVFDNEEVGSLTAQGADSTFLQDVLARINKSLAYSDEHLMISIANGFMISADNAHAVHPNHPEYADPTNRPVINGGIVIKRNASQKYSTDAVSEAYFKKICKEAKVPVQMYVNRSDIAGGSTLGNLSNRHISIPTVDIGLPQLAMHSSYETAGVKDIDYMIKMCKYFFNL